VIAHVNNSVWFGPYRFDRRIRLSWCGSGHLQLLFGLLPLPEAAVVPGGSASSSWCGPVAPGGRRPSKHQHRITGHRCEELVRRPSGCAVAWFHGSKLRIRGGGVCCPRSPGIVEPPAAGRSTIKARRGRPVARWPPLGEVDTPVRLQSLIAVPRKPRCVAFPGALPRAIPIPPAPGRRPGLAR